MANVSVTLWILVAAVFLCRATFSYEIHGVDLAVRLMEVVRDGLGQEKIQETFDEYASFDTSLADGDEIVQTLASSLGSRLNLYNTALTKLRQAVSDNYAGFRKGNSSINQCCKVDVNSLNYDRNLKSVVDSNDACYRRPSNMTEKLTSLPQPILETMRSNYKLNPNLGWQYIATEEGITVSYPEAFAGECNYDPRVRPWYAETYAPRPKDIVIVFENTELQVESSIEEAVEILLNTTNPNDRIAILKFGTRVTKYLGSSNKSPCYSKDLALATPQNRDAFLEFVKRTETSKTANYLLAINDAFNYFENAADTANRSRLIVFIAASPPSDVANSDEITNVIRGRNSKFAEKVVIQTFAFGKDVSEATRNILKDMAESTDFINANGNSQAGNYTWIKNRDRLRSQLRSYYNMFADSASVTSPLVTVPYVDLWGLGLVVSLCLPFNYQGRFEGVACLDAKIEDIFFNVTYYHQGMDTYAFIIDSRGRTVLHPNLPKPTAILKNSIFIDISTLERETEANEIIASMKGGGTGRKNFYTKRNSQKQGVAVDPTAYGTVLSHYFWTKVPHTDYSLCVVFTDRDGMVDMNLYNKIDTPPNYIHPYDIDPTRADLCQHSGTAATKKSLPMFNGAAYRQLTYDVDPHDPIQKNAYTNFFLRNAHDQTPSFKRKTRVWVFLTGLVDSIWKTEPSSQYDSVIRWRHLVTTSGVIRLYPGTVYRTYDPSIFSWYKLAILNLGWIQVRKLDGENFNLMISQSIFKGSKDGRHAISDTPVAVVGGEIRSIFIYNILEDLYPVCRTARCFVIDENANVLAHKAYSGTLQNASHLITMEPKIARFLRDTEQLVKTSCLNFEKYTTQVSWIVSLKSWVASSRSPHFELHTVQGTNVYVGVTWEADNSKTTCNCQDLTECHQNQNQDDQCECPCFQSLTFNFCNNSLPIRGGKVPPTCPIQKQVFDIIEEANRGVNVSLLDPCFTEPCRGAPVRSMCLELPGCKWCMANGEKTSGCHGEEVQCDSNTSSPIAAIIIPIILLLVIIGVLIFICVTRRCCPGLIDKCWSSVPCVCPFGTKKEQKEHDIIMGVSPSISNLPRAPERPPPGRNGNSYFGYDRSLESSTDPPTLPSMDGRPQTNRGYSEDNGSIYYEVDPDPAIGGRFSSGNQRTETMPNMVRENRSKPLQDRAMTDPGIRPPSEQYLHPDPRNFHVLSSGHPSTQPSSSLSSSSGPSSKASWQRSGFDNQSGNYPSGNISDEPQSQQQYVPYSPLKQPSTSKVPPIPTFPDGPPHNKAINLSSPDNSLNSASNGNAVRYQKSLPKSDTSFQEEPFDLSQQGSYQSGACGNEALDLTSGVYKKPRYPSVDEGHELAPNTPNRYPLVSQEHVSGDIQEHIYHNEGAMMQPPQKENLDLSLELESHDNTERPRSPVLQLNNNNNSFGGSMHEPEHLMPGPYAYGGEGEDSTGSEREQPNYRFHTFTNDSGVESEHARSGGSNTDLKHA